MANTAFNLEFHAIMEDTQSRIRAYVAGMGIAPHEVDDLTQDVYVELYRNFEKMPEGILPIRWLKGIAKNVCLNYLRKSARRGRLHHEAMSELLQQTKTVVEDLWEEGSITDILEDCVEQLPENRREILDLKYQKDFSSADIADALKSTSQAVRVALHRIRTIIKECVTTKLAQEL